MPSTRTAAMKMAALLILFSPLFSGQSSDPPLNDDVLGLIVFKAGLFDPLSRLTSWNEEDDSPCKWVGVKCDPTRNRVTQLVLDGFSLSGHIGSKGLIRLQSLTTLNLSKNNLSGPINPIISQLQSLRIIDLSENALSGPIPQELFQRCDSLKSISLAKNNLTGEIPGSLTSCSSLEKLNFSSNGLTGQLPPSIWSLSSLKSLDFSYNMLKGEIPRGIEGLVNLRLISLRKNSFVGRLPENIGRCLLTKSIDFGGNYLSGELPISMRKLTNCRFLDLSENMLSGKFPDWIGEMGRLELLNLSNNLFYGSLPTSIGNLRFLQEFDVSNNRIVGNLPDSFQSCANLKVLDAGKNMLSGNLPLWAVLKLPVESVSLSGNKYGGSIDLPDVWLQSFKTLRVLDLSSNALSGEIPPSIGNFSSLQYVNMSKNALIGSIPQTIAELNAARILDLNRNNISGKIPESISNCSALTSLFLSMNNLIGVIPPTITNLANLELVDLSHNNLSGNLPKELSNLSHLITFNVSFNNLEGELPQGGIFNTIPLTSIAGNPSLCGSITKRSCPSVHPKPFVLNPNSSVPNNHSPFSSNLKHKRITLSVSSLIAIGAAVFIALGVITVSVLNVLARTSMEARSAAANNFTFSGGEGDEFSPSPGNEEAANYGKLVMFSGESTFVSGAQSLLNKDCELGRGGFGTVYRTELQNGKSVAIKKLTTLVKNQEDFEREVRVLGNISHENIVAIEGYYWTPSLQLLINEYLPGGSLHKHLHDEGSNSNCSSLTWEQRFKVILGTAKALSHLHCSNLIHYDVKSANVLLTHSGEPKVGDFGLAQLLPAMDRFVLSGKIQSGLGYMAPEFACPSVKLTEKCDVYGFGILILEVISGKRPVEYMEDDVVVLCDMVRAALGEGRVEKIIDGRLAGEFPMEEAAPIVKLGLVCASRVPSNRPEMGEVVRILELIRCPNGEDDDHCELE